MRFSARTRCALVQTLGVHVVHVTGKIEWVSRRGRILIRVLPTFSFELRTFADVECG